ncbi:MAG: AtpZ/AtpI family protein [Pseudomonadota bacterium]
MAGPDGPGETGSSGPGLPPAGQRGDDLDKRRRDLEAAIAARRPEKKPDDPASRSDGMAGMGYALRLSSEFIAGVVVGAAIGWFVDRMAGTSPWGLIVFLFLGFGAGVLNVLRSAGLVADQGVKPPKGE